MSDEIIKPIDITPEGSVSPVYLLPLTPEEEANRQQWNAIEADEIAAQQARVAAKESALAKLAKLGLTEEEARAVIGI